MYNSNFGNRSRGGSSFRGGRDSDRPQMYDAVCDECGNSCKVPFRPTGDRPIYCSDCFEKRGNGRDSRDGRDSRGGRDNQRSSYSRPQFNDRDRDSSRAPQRPNADPKVAELSRNIEILNTKLDKLISLLANNTPATILSTPQKKEKDIQPKQFVSKKVVGLAEMVAAFKTNEQPSVVKKTRKVISPKSKKRSKK